MSAHAKTDAGANACASRAETAAGSKTAANANERGSAEELLQHPFITQLPPKKIIRAEIGEHLRTLQNLPAKKGLKGVALWTLKQLGRACNFCTKTSAEQEAALQMALGGFSCY
ncbi:hypothetical protein XELAEV_18041637mg [Xenopus laevis]|uniref:Uncharacterized protein n=1 Tax=Xenopus laevis TaxID=8355 RepID=A0A974C2Q7_XENLA|nr:hypothetical protein XELAEV_18041637mg [Xenopus laevis]